MKFTKKELCGITCMAKRIAERRGAADGLMLTSDGRCCAEGAMALACGVPPEDLREMGTVAELTLTRPTHRRARSYVAAMEKLLRNTSNGFVGRFYRLNDAFNPYTLRVNGEERTVKGTHQTLQLAADLVCPVKKTKAKKK